MRKGLILFIIANALIIGFLINLTSNLIALLFDDVSRDAIAHDEIPSIDVPPKSYERPMLIPKIIHQTYINDSIPEVWKKAQQSCIDLHPDYEYKLWTDEKSREFIAKEYPWFLPTFDGYKFPIQRADSIRYFILSYYGGVYLDLDDGCARKLDPLLTYRAWVRKTAPTGISNDAMGSIPQHPFFLSVIRQLQHYNRDWAVPYITVMYSTGPLFLSVVWKKYGRATMDFQDRVRVLMPKEYNKGEEAFFFFNKGNSWHQNDAKAIFWMGRHWLLITISGFALAGCLYFCCWFTFYRRPSSPNTRMEKKKRWWRRDSNAHLYRRVSRHDV